MAGQRIEGKSLAAGIKAEVKEGVLDLKDQGIEPCLAVILVGDNPASQVYVRGKEKDCAECGIKSLKIDLPGTATQQEVLDVLDRLAKDPAVHGILVQLPLPGHIDEQAVIGAIPADKDVDGFTPMNVGRLAIGQPCFMPCTPAGCLRMIQSTGIDLEGKQAVVVGRSNLVGKPAALLLLAQHATVTICHSHTRGLKELCRQADVLVAAVGRAGFITGDMIKENAVVIDVGINRDENGKLCGDVVYDEAVRRASYITPVPGGVGLMTRAMLMYNTLRAAKLASGEEVY